MSGEFQRTMIAVNDYHSKERKDSRKLNWAKIFVYRNKYLNLVSFFLLFRASNHPNFRKYGLHLLVNDTVSVASIVWFLRTTSRPLSWKWCQTRWRKNRGKALFAHRRTANSNDVCLKKYLLQRIWLTLFVATDCTKNISLLVNKLLWSTEAVAI